eukprot:3458036-Ditylum_brightwellii.AAC.1
MFHCQHEDAIAPRTLALTKFKSELIKQKLHQGSNKFCTTSSHNGVSCPSLCHLSFRGMRLATQ